jgi:hypothetical protein
MTSEEKEKTVESLCVEIDKRDRENAVLGYVIAMDKKLKKMEENIDYIFRRFDALEEMIVNNSRQITSVKNIVDCIPTTSRILTYPHTINIFPNT